MQLAIASDHAGLKLKNRVIDLLKQKGIEVKDFGTENNESVDYPDFGMQVAEAVSRGQMERGILLCGSGIGMSIVANKYRRVRAALCYDIQTARLSREHNDANILVMGGRVLDEPKALEIVKTWLETEFEGGRHARRIKKILEIENNNMHHPKVKPPNPPEAEER
ncbi:MAG TPA: ribose 5-phosphate isomerase B [Nitrospiria bacterium]|nr:ribose 5-phosphate isomerase B [Nitrospiria bacterium]